MSPSLKSSLDVLATLLQYKAQLKALLPSDFLHRVWTELASQDVSACIDTLHNSEHMQLVFEAATEKELYAILQDLKVITVSVHYDNVIFTSVLGDCLKIRDPYEFE
jgi:predicted polyphosphate/ATP-dependent NAD kinase